MSTNTHKTNRNDHGSLSHRDCSEAPQANTNSFENLNFIYFLLYTMFVVEETSNSKDDLEDVLGKLFQTVSVARFEFLIQYNIVSSQ